MNLMNGSRYCVRLILSQNTVCDRESITREISMGWAGYRLLSLNSRMGCIEYTSGAEVYCMYIGGLDFSVLRLCYEYVLLLNRGET